MTTACYEGAFGYSPPVESAKQFPDFEHNQWRLPTFHLIEASSLGRGADLIIIETVKAMMGLSGSSHRSVNEWYDTLYASAQHQEKGH